jgi:extracellular elastinolytic metalloproteinase
MKSFLYASLAASLALPSVLAHPQLRPHITRDLKKRAVDVNTLKYSVAGLGTEYVNAKAVGSGPALIKRADAKDTATELVKKTVPGATFELVNDHYVGDNGVAHYNFKQTVNGLVVANSHFNVNVSPYKQDLITMEYLADLD